MALVHGLADGTFQDTILEWDDRPILDGPLYPRIFSALALTGEGGGPFESFTAVAVVHQLNHHLKHNKNSQMEWLY